MKTSKAPLKEEEKTDAQKIGLSGSVHHVMQTCYKANLSKGATVQGKIEMDYGSHDKNFIQIFNEQGKKVQEQVFGTTMRHVLTYNEKGQRTEDIQYYKGKLYTITTFTYNERGNAIENVARLADGTLHYKVVQEYDSEGRNLGRTHYQGKDGAVALRSVITYNKEGKMLSSIEYKGDGTIDHQTIQEYDNKGNRVKYRVEYFDKTRAHNSQSQSYRYNEHNDCIEMNWFDHAGTLTRTSSFSYEYDKDGKRIVKPHPPYDPHALNPGESEELEKDGHDNWVKKTTFFEKRPVNIFIREIIYFGDGNHPPLVHPASLPDAELVEEPEERDEMKEGEAKWIVEAPNTTADNFNFLRYYALKFNEVPSLINYTGPYIEAISLLRELKNTYRAKVVNSYSTTWNGWERLVRYAVVFPYYPGYLLHASGIGAKNEDEFTVPSYINSPGEDNVYISPIVFLRPADVSPNREEMFEMDISELIDKYSLRKKPEKPVINIVETSGNGFAMKEYAVNDNFEIKDLDVNYGYGFEKFHNELMSRFHSSTKGLVLFHGRPGTGKTYYIRHLLRKMVASRKAVIYMPPNMVDHLVEPVFMTFLTNEVRALSEDGNFCVLLIEDAEPLLARRQEGVRIQGVTNLLNMSDGLLNDMLNLQIICTFNVDLRKLDSALLRPGRLIARKEFKELSVLDANLLAQRLGIKHHFTHPATLGEIYAMRKNSNTLIHDVDADKGASSVLDDLL